MVAEIARGSQVRAAAGTRRRNRRESAKRLRRPPSISALIGVVERKAEQLQIILAVLADAEARADDDTAHGRLIEYVAAGDIGHRHAVAFGHRVHDRQQVLQRLPSARLANEATVLHLRPGFEPIPVGLRPAKPALGEESAGNGAEGEHGDAVPMDTARSCRWSMRADRAVKNKPGSTRSRCRCRRIILRCAVSTFVIPEITNQPLVLELLQVAQRIQIARIGIVPGVKLQQVDPVAAQAVERRFNRRPHIVAAGGSRGRHPLGEELHGVRAVFPQRTRRCPRPIRSGPPCRRS